jgi:hypothetical protein
VKMGLKEVPLQLNSAVRFNSPAAQASGSPAH